MAQRKKKETKQKTFSTSMVVALFAAAGQALVGPPRVAAGGPRMLCAQPASEPPGRAPGGSAPAESAEDAAKAAWLARQAQPAWRMGPPTPHVTPAEPEASSNDEIEAASESGAEVTAATQPDTPTPGSAVDDGGFAEDDGGFVGDNGGLSARVGTLERDLSEASEVLVGLVEQVSQNLRQVTTRRSGPQPPPLTPSLDR